MWSVKATILLLFCYARPLTGKVYFVSKNFNNTLHWDPPASPTELVLYTVQYKSDAMDCFWTKAACENITALSCDLTAETASVYDVQYEARVFANGEPHGKTTRFKPLAQTVFGPPELSTNTTVSFLHVDVKLPLGPNGVSIADIINRSTAGHSKSVIIYTLNITEPWWATLVNKTTSGRFVIRLNNDQSDYCGHVVYRTLSDWGRPESQKAFFCARLQGDYRKLLPWLLAGAALPAVLMAMLVLYVWKYAKGGKLHGMPQSLVTTLSTKQNLPQCRDHKLNIYKVTVVPKPDVSPIGNEGYSPQDIVFQVYTGSSLGTGGPSATPNPRDTSSQCSEIYSVVAVHVPADERKDARRPPAAFRGEATPQKADAATDSKSAKPLMLDTVRDQQGQLSLPSLFSMFQSGAGDGASPLPSERKPLLSDLTDVKAEGPSLASLQSFGSSEWSDSGCDDSHISTPTICSPPRREAMFESAYKQNWIPEILRGAAGKDKCEHNHNHDDAPR